jgi:hypothetical protein
MSEQPKDQVEETRRVLDEMNKAANSVIDETESQSTPMQPKK